MAPRVLVSDELSETAVQIFRDRGVEVDFQPKLGKDKEKLAEIIGNYDGLAIRSATKVTPKLIEAAERLKVVGRAGIGVDNVDIPAATKKGIIVMNTPFGNSITTAEHAIALMFAVARQIPAADQSAQAGKWEKSRFMGVEITGKTLGVIQLQLVAKDGRWSVDRTKTVVEARNIQNADRSFVTPLPAVAETVRAEHQATIDYVKTPIGSSDFAMTSYFADVGDVSAMQIVNMAQTDYVANYVKQTMPQFASLPVLSTASPFKTGFAGGADFTDVAAGPIAINNAADLYLFPNTLYAVKVDGGYRLSGSKTWISNAPIADVFVVNKADRAGAAETQNDLEGMLSLKVADGWRPPVVPAVATSGEGVADVWTAVADHRRWLDESGEGARRRQGRVAAELRSIIAVQLAARAAKLGGGSRFEELRDEVLARDIDPWSAVDEVLASIDSRS